MNRSIYLCFLLFGCALAEEIKAHVKLTNYASGSAQDGGYLDLVQKDGKLTITGKVNNLTPKGNHGFHVHEKGSIEEKCNASGAHYNPLQKDHGGPNAESRHIGDLGNIIADDSGNAIINVTDSTALLNGQYSIMNRTIVIHKGEDDLGLGGADDSKKTGHAGGRVLCGIIEPGSAGMKSSASLIVLGLTLFFYCLQQ